MPLDRGAIDEQLRAIGEGAHWWNVRELRDLPLVLRDDEQILALGQGTVRRVRVPGRPWLVVVTAGRLVLLRSYSSTGWRHVEVGTHLIERLSLRTGPFRGRIRLAAGGRSWRIVLSREQAYRVHDALSANAAAARAALPGLGPTRVVRRMVEHVLSLPTVAFTPAEMPRLAPPPQDTAELDQRVLALEEQVQELREQIEFLEQLLRERQVQAGSARS